MMYSALHQAVQASADSNLLDIGYRIALVGMATVFSGLVILSFSLPLIRRMAEGRKKKPAVAAGHSEEKVELSKEEVVAITAAVHAHISQINRLEDMQLTWEMYERPYTPWRLAGRARTLTDRAAFRQRNRSR